MSKEKVKLRQPQTIIYQIMMMSFANFIEIALRHVCSPLNLLHIFRTPFPKNTSERRLLYDLCGF